MSPQPPPEPPGPSATGSGLRAGWLLTWLVVAAMAAVALVIAWIMAAAPELLAGLGATTAFSVTVVLHHVVVTQDIGELTAARPAAEPLATGWSRVRRRIIGLIIAGGVLVGGTSFALLRFGPRAPGETAWRSGARLMTLEGSPLRPTDVHQGSVVTVWPERAVGTELSATILIRLREPPRPPTRLTGVVDETLVAYSKLCTHAGCAVALYRDHDQALFCPCHQATFDALRGAVPISGPASYPLPQLPLGIDDDGYLIAIDDFSGPPGPVGGTV